MLSSLILTYVPYSLIETMGPVEEDERFTFSLSPNLHIITGDPRENHRLSVIIHTRIYAVAI